MNYKLIEEDGKMKYIKPEMKIEKLKCPEDILAEEESAGFVPDIDMGNDNGTDLGYETASAFSEAFKNIF